MLYPESCYFIQHYFIIWLLTAHIIFGKRHINRIRICQNRQLQQTNSITYTKCTAMSTKLTKQSPALVPCYRNFNTEFLLLRRRPRRSGRRTLRYMHTISQRFKFKSTLFVKILAYYHVLLISYFLILQLNICQLFFHYLPMTVV